MESIARIYKRRLALPDVLNALVLNRCHNPWSWDSGERHYVWDKSRFELLREVGDLHIPRGAHLPECILKGRIIAIRVTHGFGGIGASDQGVPFPRALVEALEDYMFHATRTKKYPSIMATGLSPMGRNQVQVSQNSCVSSAQRLFLLSLPQLLLSSQRQFWSVCNGCAPGHTRYIVCLSVCLFCVCSRKHGTWHAFWSVCNGCAPGPCEVPCLLVAQNSSFCYSEVKESRSQEGQESMSHHSPNSPYTPRSPHSLHSIHSPHSPHFCLSV